MFKFIKYLVIILSCFFIVPDISCAIKDPVYYTTPFDFLEDAALEDLPPIEYVQEAVDDLNSNPYFNLDKENWDVYVYTQYPNVEEYPPGACFLTTVTYSDGTIKKSCNFVFYPLRSGYNDGDLVYIAGCEKDIKDRCAISHIAYHEVGHCLLSFYWTDEEIVNYANLIGYSNESFSTQREIVCEEFAKTFGPLHSRYQIHWDGEAKYCALKYNSKPYSSYYGFYMNTKYDNPDLDNIEQRVKYDVDNNGKIDNNDFFLAQRLINKKVNDDNIGQYWSADIDCDNTVTDRDIEFIFEKLPLQSPSIIGDFDNDGKIDFEDLMILTMAYNKKFGDAGWSQADFSIPGSPFNKCDIAPTIGEYPNLAINPDGKVDFEDVMVFKIAWDYYKREVSP